MAAPEDISARVQQFLLAQGARYVSKATEENWKHAAVALDMPVDLHRPPHLKLPAGTWVVLPWLSPSTEQVDAWLAQMTTSTLRPRVVVLCLDVPTLRRTAVLALAAQYHVDVVAISAVDRECYGSSPATLLQLIFDPRAEEVLATTNPLEHLAELGDPRNPEVFFERLRRTSPHARVTSWLIRLNLALFALSTLLSLANGQPLMGALFTGFDAGTLILLGANSHDLTIAHGEFWRLLTCTFLHANLLHVGMNLYILRSLGSTAERLFGPVAFLGVYLISAVGGSLLSLAWTLSGNAHYSVGASGAVFGVMGGMLGFALSRRKSVPFQVYRSLLRSALTFTVLNLGLGAAIQAVDNGAHVGGLVGGLAAGLLLSRELPPAPQPSREHIGILVGGLLLVEAVIFAWLAQ